MKVAIVYNRESKNVVNLFGLPNQEKIGLKTIQRISNALKKGGHQVIATEGDKDLVDKLEEFMPRVVKGERPGMVFNVSYGIQGQARYTHVPSILEMVGVPYVASGPLAHSLALDKVVTKMILQQHGLPTPDFAVLDGPDAPQPELPYPLIVKPKNEAVSFGLRVVKNKAELREGVATIFEKYKQPVLVEQYVKGREVNVGLIGNNPPEALPPVELIFKGRGEKIYTWEDKTGKSGRTISHKCPAPIGKELVEKAQEIARKAFQALGCYDCARVDLRLDAEGNLYVLEVNSLPSLGEHGSYLVGAAHVGLDFDALINRLVREASARYFGTPEPPKLHARTLDVSSHIFAFVTQRRDELERRLKEWTEVTSHTGDPIGMQEIVRRVDEMFGGLGMKPVSSLTKEPAAYTWETTKGLQDGTLLVCHVDRPVHADQPTQVFRREPEWLHGDGIGTARAPLVMIQFALRSLRARRLLRKVPLGVLCYTDEGRDARYSTEILRAAAGKAKRVLVLRPGAVGDHIVTQRRGQRRYRFVAEGDPLRPGQLTKKKEVFRWASGKLEGFAEMTSRKKRLSVSAIDVQTEQLFMLLPHRVTCTLLMTYLDPKAADAAEEEMRTMLAREGRNGPRWQLKPISDRPPMKERRHNLQLARAFERLAEELEIPLSHESSVWPSVAGLVPSKIPCVCALAPVARDLSTQHEAVLRISLVQRTILLARFLARELGK